MCLVDTYLPSNLSNISSSPLKLCSIVFRVLVLAEYILPVGHITSKNKSAGSNLEKWRTIYLVFFLAYFGRYCGLLESLKKCFAAKECFEGCSLLKLLCCLQIVLKMAEKKKRKYIVGKFTRKCVHPEEVEVPKSVADTSSGNYEINTDHVLPMNPDLLIRHAKEEPDTISANPTLLQKILELYISQPGNNKPAVQNEVNKSRANIYSCEDDLGLCLCIDTEDRHECACPIKEKDFAATRHDTDVFKACGKFKSHANSATLWIMLRDLNKNENKHGSLTCYKCSRWRGEVYLLSTYWHHWPCTDYEYCGDCLFLSETYGNHCRHLLQTTLLKKLRRNRRKIKCCRCMPKSYRLCIFLDNDTCLTSPGVQLNIDCNYRLNFAILYEDQKWHCFKHFLPCVIFKVTSFNNTRGGVPEEFILALQIPRNSPIFKNVKDSFEGWCFLLLMMYSTCLATSGTTGGGTTCRRTQRTAYYMFRTVNQSANVVVLPLVMTLAMVVSWLAVLLMQCNDVESNPGPSKLSMDSILRITESLVDWKEIGHVLGFSTDAIGRIEMDCRGSVREAKILLFTHWLANDPEASWEKLAEALQRSGHGRLAAVIRTDYGAADGLSDQKRSADSIPALADLMGIPDVEKYWKSIGAQLTLRTHTLDSIERKYPRSLIRCKREMFKEALDTGLTWKDVLDALSELPLLSVVKKVCEAMEIEYEYGSSSQTLLPLGHSPAGALSATPSTGQLTTNLDSRSSIQTDSSSLSKPAMHERHHSLSPLLSLGSSHPSEIKTGPILSFTDRDQSNVSMKSSHQPLASSHLHSLTSVQQMPQSLPAPPTAVVSSPFNRTPSTSNLPSLSSTQSSLSDNSQSISSLSPLPGLKVYDHYHDSLCRDLSQPGSSIMFANKVHSLNLITRSHIYDLRTISSNEDRAAKLLDYVREAIQSSNKSFELFIACLRTIKVHEVLAESMSRSHRLQLVFRNMTKLSSKEINLTLLSTSLNDQKLISDNAKSRALSCQEPREFFSVIYNDLKATALGEDFLDFLDEVEQTRGMRTLLSEGSGGTTVRPMDIIPTIQVLPITGEEVPEEEEEEEVETGISEGNKKSPDVESDNFLSAESSLREKSMDVFHDSLPHSSIAASAGKDFLNHRQRIESDGSVIGVESQRDELEAGSQQSGGSTPKNHSDRTTSTSVSDLPNPSSAGPWLSREQQHFHSYREVDPSILQRQREKEAEFVVAVKKWDLRRVQSMLLEKSVPIDHRFEKSRTALMLAAIDNHKEAAELLIRHRASVTAVDVKGYTPLYLAAKCGNYEMLRIILKEPEVEVNIKCKLGSPVIIRAAQKGFSVITECLLEHQASPDLPSQDGLTALYAACQNQQKDVVKLLLEYGADVTRVYPKTERTPLEEAVEGEDPEIVSLIMKAEAKTRMKSKQLFTAKTPDEIKDLVIRYNAKIDCRNSAGATPLITHTISGHLDIVKKLIQLKSNIDLQDSLGYSALIVSCKAGQIDLVRLLIASGAILDLKERNNGYTGLMFAIVNVHVPVVKELVLAKANINLRNRDHKSALDLAKEGNNADIMEVVKVQSGSSSGRDDPFVQLLSTYMNNKAANPRLSAAKAQSPTKSLKSRPDSGKALSLKTYKAPLTSVTPDEPSSTKAELEKCYKRIADLEIRVHDLSTATSMDLSKDEDVSYMDKSRLETEFKKLRAAKKKAEQYAVEAKQTAQRLSAENFKLREDLNKERHFNELTRKTIVKEVEREVELNAKREKLELVRRSVFQEEVAERAYQLVQNDPNRGSIYQKVAFSGAQLKKMIMEKSIRMNMFHVVVDGLPRSGKSTLCLGMGVATEAQMPSGSVPGVDLYEAALSHSTLSNEGHQWVNFTELKGRDGPQMDMLALGLLYYLVSQHQLPKSDSLTEIDSMLFDDSIVQEYFVEMCNFLQKISTQFTTEKGALEKLLTGPFSLVNIFSIFESKPMREILQTISGQHPNVILLDLIDISKYDQELLRKGEDECYFGSPLHHLVACIESVSHERPVSPRCIVVGTHQDKVSTKDMVRKQKKDIMNLVESYASDIGVPDGVVCPDMITLDTKSPEGCQEVTDSIVNIIDQNKQVFEINIPLRFIFLRWYLHKTKQRFVTRSELINHAKKCGIDDQEIDEFLKIFRACGSIISTELNHEFLHDHFILLPVVFFRELCKLYTMDKDGTIPREYLASTRYGVVSDRTLRSLWQGQAGDISISDFYINVLDNFGLLANLGNDEYYIPSLKADYDMPKAPDADSLIITMKRPYIPLRKQVEFVKYFLNSEKLRDKFVFLEKSAPSSPNCCNTTYFREKEAKKHSPAIRIRFLVHHIEFSVVEGKLKEANTYSLLKTALVDIMNNVGVQWKPFRFTFNIVCPNTKGKRKIHFCPFDILETSVENIMCSECATKVNFKDKKFNNRLLWIQAAFTGSPQSVIHPDDVLNPKKIQKICKELDKKSTSSNLLKICRLLCDTCFPDSETSQTFNPLHLDHFSKTHRSVEDVLYHSIYTWHCFNVKASKVTLARKLKDLGYYNEAFTIDPSVYQEPIVKERVTTITSQEVLEISDWWPSKPSELAKILKSKLSRDDSSKLSARDQCISLLNSWVKDNSGGDQRKRLHSLLEQNEYFLPSDNFLV